MIKLYIQRLEKEEKNRTYYLFTSARTVRDASHRNPRISASCFPGTRTRTAANPCTCAHYRPQTETRFPRRRGRTGCCQGCTR